MILFKVSFKNNIAIAADGGDAHLPPIEWKETPYSIVAIEVWANNNVQALQLAQQKANVLLKQFH
ncbi:MAG: hypothetical protein QM726_08865 [Chitinophagaceae bacterium]